MPEAIIGPAELLALGIGSKFMPFKTWRNVGDIRTAKHELAGLKRDELQAHVAKAKGDIEAYVRDHKDGLQHAESAVGHLYDSIKLDIIDLQITKGIIRQLYKDDEELRRKGLPDSIGRGLRNGIAHTRQRVNQIGRAHV